jgi:DNA-binding PadR family transcriptional regulator
MKRDDPLLGLSPSALALMAILSEGPMTGYRLKKVIDSPGMAFWRDSFGSIYPNLGKMERKGLARRHRDDTGGRKRIVYALTESGLDLVRRWLSAPSLDIPIKAELLLKLRYAEAMGPEAQVSLLRSFLRHQKELLPDLYETLQHLEGLEPDARVRTRWMIADFRYRFTRMLVEWAEDSMDMLEDTTEGE